jgi:outer membrane receptor protein involved in Fe transport
VRQGANKSTRPKPTIGRPIFLPLLIGCPSALIAQEQAENEPVQSEQASPPAGEVAETIIITGSRIPQRNLTAVSPVTVLDQTEVQLQGGILAEEVLNQLPQVAPSQGTYISNGASGTATVDLRNLGPARTLVLINGRRLGPGDPGMPVADINLIPTTLIRKVEVLTGGATSVYGSDAVAGVVNFILDTRLDGFRVDGQASVYQHDNRNGSGLQEALQRAEISYPDGNTVDGGRQDINVAFGKGFFDNRAQVTLYAGYRKIEELRQNARDYSACVAAVNQADNSVLECGGSPTSYPGNFFTNFGPLTIGDDRTFVPGFIPFNFSPWIFYQRPGRRWSAGGFANFEISSAIQPYVEVMWMDDRSVAQIAPSGNFGSTQTVNCDNPLLSDQQREAICTDGNFVGQRILGGEILGAPIPFTDPVTGATYFRANAIIGRRGVESGGRQEDLRHKTIRILGGLKGNVGRGVSYDASYLHTRARLSNAHLNDFSVTRLQRALDVVNDPGTGQPVCRSVLTGEDPSCVPWDIFALGAVTADATAYLSLPSFLQGSVTEQLANTNATVDLGEWGVRSPWSEETPMMNFGAEYRKDTLNFDPDELAQSGDLAGIGTEILPIHGSTRVKELFVEVRVPVVAGDLIERLAFEGGYRRSWYTAGSANFSSTAYKLALDLTAVRGFRLRGSHQRAVRAPNVLELFAAPSADSFFHDPCEGVTPQATQEQCARTGVTPEQYGQIIPVPGSLSVFNAVSGGNEELQPEIATTRTLGLVLEPRFLPGFSATIDWWDIQLKEAIARVDGDTIIETCVRTGDPVLCGRIHRDSNGSLWLTPEGFIDTRQLNLAAYKLRGIDVEVTYRHALGRWGSATVNFLGSYLDRFIVDRGGLTVPIDCAGRFGFICTNPTPRWRHKARLTWDSTDDISLSFQWRRTNKMKVEPIPDLPPPGPIVSEVEGRSYFDVAALFRIQRQFQLRLGVNNIFDTEPPLVPGDQGCPNIYCSGNTYPQWFDPLGRYFFAGVTFDLN